MKFIIVILIRLTTFSVFYWFFFLHKAIKKFFDKTNDCDFHEFIQNWIFHGSLVLSGKLCAYSSDYFIRIIWTPSPFVYDGVWTSRGKFYQVCILHVLGTTKCGESTYCTQFSLCRYNQVCVRSRRYGLGEMCLLSGCIFVNPPPPPPPTPPVRRSVVKIFAAQYIRLKFKYRNVTVGLIRSSEFYHPF